MPQRIRLVDHIELVGVRNNLTILTNIAEDHKWGARAVRTNFRCFQRSKTLAECDLLVIRHRLVRKVEDGISCEGIAQVRECCVIERFAEIDAGDPGAEAGCQWFIGQHDPLSRVPVEEFPASGHMRRRSPSGS